MAKLATSVSLFLSLLFLFTLSHARNIQDLLPESKPESEAATYPEPNKPQRHHDTVSFTLDSVDPVPLTFLHFHPINRHFNPARHPLLLSLRTGHRRCRHGHRREIPYGNDAIVLSDAVGEDRRIQPRWVRVHSFTEPRLPEMVGHPDSDHDLDHKHHHHVHGEHHHHHHHEDGWFAKKIRKFLNLF
ncbi:hypothetical protein VNO77_42842 [Canavalia gladiata]|uniref:Uncharacterized protein n=1 Tax=Canavalia gladiata TaxID=3824 RepID=A0AAN9JVG8_CANGL